MSFLHVQGITAGYGRQRVIKDIGFHLEAGRLLGIIGANGSGKTTLLKALCGILPHQGCCMLDDTRLEALSARQLAALVSYIPQRSGIAIDISALDVVLMGFNPQLGLLEHPTGTMRQTAMDALCRVGLGEKSHMNLGSISFLDLSISAILVNSFPKNYFTELLYHIFFFLQRVLQKKSKKIIQYQSIL